MIKITGLNGQANSYIIKRFDGVMLVDPASDYEKIKEHIEGLKLWGILLTHGHSSHLSLIGKFDCPIYLHKNDYFLFTDDEVNGFLESDKKREYEYNRLDLKLIDENTTLKLVDRIVKVVHVPGHTKGSVCYYYDNILYTGDTLTLKGPGFSKRESSSNYQIRKSIKKIYDEFSINTTVCPGHGEVTTLLEIRQKNESIRKLLKK